MKQRSNKKKRGTDTCHNTDEPLELYAKWKKPDAIVYILYKYVYRKCLEKANV